MRWKNTKTQTCFFCLDGGVPFKVKLSDIQPVDIYFLMDFSASMSDEKNMLHAQASAIANAIGQITTDYRIGFGGFCDKPVSPFGGG